jgi:hypothetical protein
MKTLLLVLTSPVLSLHAQSCPDSTRPLHRPMDAHQQVELPDRARRFRRKRTG